MRKDILYKTLEYQDELLSRKIVEFDKPYRFSGRYKRRKKLIIKAAAVEEGFESGYSKAVKALRIKYMLLALLALILCVLITFIFSGVFRGTENNKHINSTAPAVNSYPQIIDDTVSFTETLLWYDADKKEVSPLNIFANYNSGEGRAVTLRKWDGKALAPQYYNESDEISVNGHKGFIADGSDDNGTCGIFWDNGEYAFEISGAFTRDELLDIANAVEVRMSAD